MLKEGLMTAQEVAAYLHCSVSTVHRLVRRGKIPHYRLGKMVRFRRREIDNWLVLHHEGERVPEVKSPSINPDQLSLFGAG